MKIEKNKRQFSSMRNIYLIIIVLTFGMLSCKKSNERLNNTNNNTYSDTAFINNIAFHAGDCGTYFNITKNVSYSSTHSAASILSQYTSTVGSSIIWSIFQLGVENDNKVQIQDIFNTFAYYNNDFNSSLEFIVNSETQVSSNILADSLIFHSDYKFFKIVNVEAELIGTVLNRNPLSVQFEIKILKGKLVNNSIEYDLSNANVKFIDTYTFSTYVNCNTGCYSFFQNIAYVGNVKLYKGQTNDTLVHEFINDTILVSIYPYISWYNSIIINNLLENNIQISSRSLSCFNGITGIEYGQSEKMSFNKSPYIHVFPNTIYSDNINFYRDSIKINRNIEGILKTNDLSIINQNIDTIQSQRYSIQGKFIRL